MNDIRVGVFCDMSFDEYCAAPGINNSTMAGALKSGKHYCHDLNFNRVDTQALSFGRLCHAGRLEPVTVLDRYVVQPDLTTDILINGEPAKNPRATTEYKQRVEQWRAQNAGREELDAQSFDRLKGVLCALHANHKARAWLNSDGAAEVSLFWRDEDSGLPCKARVDKVVNNHLLVDLKTTRDASTFERSLVLYGYDRQAAWYVDAWRHLTGHAAAFAFVVVESEPPHGVRCAIAGADVICAGRAKYLEALPVIRDVLLNDQHSDYPEVDTFSLPQWSRRTLALTMHGQPLEAWDNVD